MTKQEGAEPTGVPSFGGAIRETEEFARREREKAQRFVEAMDKLWLHAFAPGGFGNPQVRRFEILAVPTSLLIGPDGTILAVNPRGEHTVAQIRQALREPRRP